MRFVCVYILKKQNKKKIKKNSRFPNLSQKKRKKKKEKRKKSLWTRGIEPLSHLKKKKKFFELGALDFLVTFFKKCPFFFFQRFQDSLKSPFQNDT